jgi:hypothetical protein
VSQQGLKPAYYLETRQALLNVCIPEPAQWVLRFHALWSHFHCAGDKIEKNEMNEACSADGVGERRVQGFGGKTSGKETTGETQA